MSHAGPASDTSPLLRHQSPRPLPQPSPSSSNNTARTNPSSTDESRAPSREGEDNDNDNDNDLSTATLLKINTSIWLGVFLSALDTTVVATLTAPISSSFQSLSLLSWLATAYLIANAACQPLSGKLTDIFSRRSGLLVSNLFFGVGTLICGLAGSAEMVVAGRVVAGVGGGGLSCIATFVSSDLVPLRRRGLWQGFGNLVFGVGMGVGGVFGGMCADTIGWRWAFLVQMPFVVVSAVAVWWFVDGNLQDRRKGMGVVAGGNGGTGEGEGEGGARVKSDKKSRLARIDFLGAGLLVVTLVLLLLGLNTGGNQLPWNHPFVISSLVLSVIFMSAFLWVESSPNITPEPIIPVSLVIRTRTVLAACLVNWFATMSSFLALYFIPLYLQSILHLSSTSAGLRVIPFSIGTSIGSLGGGYIMRATGRYRLLNICVMTLFVAGAALLATFSPATPSWATFVYVIPIGTGYGSMLTITLVAMISAVPHEYQAVITAASYAFRSTGSSIGISIASAVFQNILTERLRGTYGNLPDADDVIKRIKNSLDEINHLPDGWDADVVRGFNMEALRGAFLAGLGLAVLAAVSGLFMREHVLHKNMSRK